MKKENEGSQTVSATVEVKCVIFMCFQTKFVVETTIFKYQSGEELQPILC